MTVVIGLTGSIATGKSTISHMFSEFDIPVIDADQLSREVVEPGEKAYESIIDTFGNHILHEDGTLDRKALGSIVFKDESKRETLNGIVHPAVRERMIAKRDQYKAEHYPAVVLDIPLLFESKLSHYVDKIIVVYVDETIQLERLMHRDKSSQAEAMERIQAQIPVKEKAEMAHEIIDNSQSRESSYHQLKHILSKWNIL
ncbi:dephospho-CoA kinase [Thalassobacillus sp. CUG 92003]|uniref:dephospho-CoA kinase n=1 Tax=Thalassobacillus sp. CUG 92003 TaxID=2736641 RepID=UPI0015E65440|nr:dephospho-CoA kinase [Thalassobacillus sp. CUG 92003]